MAKKLLFVNRQFRFCRFQFQIKHAWKSSGLLGKMTGSCVWWGMKLNITVFWLHYSCELTFLCFCLSCQHQSCRITHLRMYKLRASHLFLELHWPSALQCHHIHISIYSSLLRTLLLWINYDEATLCCVVLIFFFSIFGYVYKISHHVSTISVQKRAIQDKHGASTTFQPKEILLPAFYKNDTGVSIYSF